LAKKNSKEKKRKERGTFFKKYTHKTIFVFCCFLFLFCFFVFFFFGVFFLRGG
jgi:quinol-cytochrome oxidoreductase complex cytochrome b subunit